MNESILCRYWGWGGEDDELYTRLVLRKQKPKMLPEKLGRFKVSRWIVHFLNIPFFLVDNSTISNREKLFSFSLFNTNKTQFWVKIVTKV